MREQLRQAALVAAYGTAGVALAAAWCVIFAAIVVVDPRERAFQLKQFERKSP